MAKAMKAMKAMAAMKAMKAMKKKAVSKIAKGKLGGFPWIQGKDHWWLDCLRLGEEQAWKDCEQERSCQWQEGLCQHQGLDCCSPEGKEGTQREGLRRCQERSSSLQEGKGVLQLSVSGWLQLRPWGYLQPWSAAASDCIG